MNDKNYIPAVTYAELAITYNEYGRYWHFCNFVIAFGSNRTNNLNLHKFMFE